MTPFPMASFTGFPKRFIPFLIPCISRTDRQTKHRNKMDKKHCRQVPGLCQHARGQVLVGEGRHVQGRVQEPHHRLSSRLPDSRSDGMRCRVPQKARTLSRRLPETHLFAWHK